MLYASDVILMEREVLCVDPLVDRSHCGSGVIRMLQTQSVTELMNRNQEQIYTCERDRRSCGSSALSVHNKENAHCFVVGAHTNEHKRH